MVTRERNLRVMVDANVLVAGTGWPRWPYALLRHAVAGDYQLVLSPYVIQEARHHLGRLVPHLLPDFEDLLAESQYEEVPDPAPEVVAAHSLLVRDAKDVPVALEVMFV
jgi:predicted nucleic acid-binding protein